MSKQKKLCRAAGEGIGDVRVHTPGQGSGDFSLTFPHLGVSEFYIEHILFHNENDHYKEGSML